MSWLDAFLCALFTLVVGAVIGGAVVLLITYVSLWAGIGALVLIALTLMTAGNRAAGRDWQ